MVALQSRDITGTSTQPRALYYILKYLNQIPMPEGISKPKSKVMWVKGLNGAGRDMQRAGAIGNF